MKKYFSLFIAILISALLLNPSNQWYIFIPVVILIFFVNRRAFYIFLKWKFNLLLLSLLLGVPLLLGEKDTRFLGISYSSEYFQMSLLMFNRSILILLGIKMFTNKISIQEIASGLQKIHLYHFSILFSTALRALPEIRVIAQNTFSEFRRTPRHTNVFSHLYNWLVKLMVRIVYFADQYYLDQLKQQKQE